MIENDPILATEARLAVSLAHWTECKLGRIVHYVQSKSFATRGVGFSEGDAVRDFLQHNGF